SAPGSWPAWPGACRWSAAPRSATSPPPTCWSASAARSTSSGRRTSWSASPPPTAPTPPRRSPRTSAATTRDTTAPPPRRGRAFFFLHGLLFRTRLPVRDASGPGVDPVHELGELLVGQVLGQVGLADHADDAAVPHHRQPPDLVLLHALERLLDRGVGRHPHQPRRHVAGPCPGRVVARGHALHHDVAVGDDAGHPV